MHLVVGLGNPGREYQHHRHNVGFMVADVLAARWALPPWKSKFGSELALGEFASRPAGSHRVALLKPMEFMNLSGQAVQRAAAFHQVHPKNILVIHDDIDLDFGRLKLKAGGGHGGHNGLRSITEHLGPEFLRVRVGVGHPGSKDRVVGHVLGPFSKSEQAELEDVLALAAGAVESLIVDGVTPAMNRYNQVEGPRSAQVEKKRLDGGGSKPDADAAPRKTSSKN